MRTRRPGPAALRSRAWALWAALWGASLGCGGSTSPEQTLPVPEAERTSSEAPASAAGAACATEPIDVEVAPGTRPEHRDVAFWLAKLSEGQADAVLVDAPALGPLNARFSEVEGAWRDPLDPQLGAPASPARDITERATWIRAQVAEGKLVEGRPGSIAASETIAIRADPVDELRMVVEEASLWCVALDTGLYKPPIDRDFDRNRCASLHPGELVRVLGRSDGAGVAGGPWLHVHAGHTTGWLHAPVLTPALPIEHVQPLLVGPRLVPTDDALRTESGRRLRLGTTVPIVGRDGDTRRVLVPTAEGLVEDRVTLGHAHEGVLPLTRRNVWSVALSELDTPYGWGGRSGHRDCSRLTRDTFSSFGIQLARHSGVQAELGTHNVDVSTMSEADKLATLHTWAERGVVLLYMPGHIMLYLGHDGPAGGELRADEHYAVSAISEYLVPCEGGPDTVYRLGRVAVTSLELGRGSERTAYIERLSRLVVFAPQ